MKIVKVNVSVPYSFQGNTTDELRLTQVNALKNILIADGMLPGDTPDATWYHHSWEITCTSDYAFDLQHDLGYSVEKSDYGAFIPQFIKDAFINSEKVPVPTGAMETHEYFNERVEVHMPGHSLAMFNAVMLLSDACTDALQDNLNQGWRILAVCPQPDQRRPDYILGRYEEPANLNHKGAARG